MIREELSVVETDVSRMAEQADAIERMVEGSLAGVIVRGVIDPDTAGKLVQCLERDGNSLPTFRPPVFKGYILGRPLVSASDGLHSYLDAADLFRAGCAAIFAEYPRLAERIHGALAALSGGRPVSPPCGTDGRPYLTETIRVLLAGDRLPLHYENETFQRPVMEELRPILDPATLMSFYIPLNTPGAGGVLRLFRVNCLGGGDSLIERLGGEERAQPQFERRGFSIVLPRIGDLLVFDGGRWYHDVTPVEAGTRWTLGGFLAATRDHRAVHYWS